MANDRETKSFEVKPERPQDTSAAIRAADTGDRLTHGEAGGTMAGNGDADLRPHGESGSSGVGTHQAAGNPESVAHISSRDPSGTAGSESGGGSGGLGSSPGTMPGMAPD
jgi:hypothetical protein